MGPPCATVASSSQPSSISRFVKLSLGVRVTLFANGLVPPPINIVPYDVTVKFKIPL